MYKLTSELLGEGAYAKVQGAVSLQNGKEYAVKVSVSSGCQTSHTVAPSWPKPDTLHSMQYGNSVKMRTPKLDSLDSTLSLLTRCVTLGKLLNTSVLQFPSL